MRNIAVSILLFFSSLVYMSDNKAFAQSKTTEELVITTYYPVPYGDYEELRVKHLAVGEHYYSADYACWETGKCANFIDEAVDVAVEGDVTIGKFKAATYDDGKKQGKTNLDVAGYAAVKDLWLSSPQYGDPRWVSGLVMGDFVGQCMEYYPSVYDNFYWYSNPLGLPAAQDCTSTGQATCLSTKNIYLEYLTRMAQRYPGYSYMLNWYQQNYDRYYRNSYLCSCSTGSVRMPIGYTFQSYSPYSQYYGGWWEEYSLSAYYQALSQESQQGYISTQQLQQYGNVRQYYSCYKPIE